MYRKYIYVTKDYISKSVIRLKGRLFDKLNYVKFTLASLLPVLASFVIFDVSDQIVREMAVRIRLNQFIVIVISMR